LPGWIKALAPKSAQRVDEKSWNAYPYTKSIYTCPFLEKFSFEVETYYYQDRGIQDNVFNLSVDDLRRRQLDMVNIVADKLPSSDYDVSEDPAEFVSEKSGRGPLNDTWLDKWHGDIMCSYKLCRIEFRYWGMQTRVERFIADIIRKTMLRAHRQAWCWQDEWLGLQIEDIRRLEREAQSALQRLGSEEEEVEGPGRKNNQAVITSDPAVSTNVNAKLSRRTSSIHSYYSVRSSVSIDSDTVHKSSETDSPKGFGTRKSTKTESLGRLLGQNTLKDEMAALRMDAIEVGSQNESDSESDIYYDAQQELEETQMFYSSVEIQQELMGRKPEHHTDGQHQFADADTEDDKESSTEEEDYSFNKTVAMKPLFSISQSQAEILVLIFHGGSAIETRSEVSNKSDDFQTLQSTVEEIVKKHYRFTKGHIAFRLVPCPPVCKSAIELLSRVDPNPQSSTTHPALGPHLPLVSLAIHAIAQYEYREIISNIIDKANEEFEEFRHSEEGQDFMGTVCIVGDCMGGLLAYDALCYYDLFSHEIFSGSPSIAHSRSSSNSSLGAIGGTRTSPQLTRKYYESSGGDEVSSTSLSMPVPISPITQQHKTRKSVRSTSTGTARHGGGDLLGVERQAIRGVSCGLTFEVSDLFLLGCPLGHVIAYRQLSQPSSGHPLRPNCSAVYNLFHCWDPMACRVEPLLDERFKSLPPVAVPQYDLFPLGDRNGTSQKISATVQSRPDIFVCQDANGQPVVQVDRMEPPVRKPSGSSSFVSADPSEGLSFQDIGGPMNWWSDQRLDYSVFCPEAVESFPPTSLPMWMHASYWESMDVAAFILRTIVHERYVDTLSVCTADDGSIPFLPMQPREKWNHKKTGYKISSLSEYHRGYDSAVLESCPQAVSARFAYGPLDLVSLIGEAVDVYVLSPGSSTWAYMGTSNTDKKGRLQFELPQDRQLTYGIHEVRMLVRGDHTVARCCLFVLQPGVEAVVFSIDGSFAGSLSIRGRNPKLRYQAVDVVRHWQELGYLIVYITGRPDMQKSNVMMWLAENNFPLGMVFFCNGLVREPQKHKTAFLKSLQDEVRLAGSRIYFNSVHVKNLSIGFK
jgi:hypothetical protein